MSIANNLDEAQKKVKELQDQLRDLTLEPSAIIDTDNLIKANNAINTLTKAVTAAKKEASDLEEGFGGVFNNVVKIVGEMKKGNSAADLATKSFKSIQDITQKLKYDQQDISKLNLDQLKSLQKKLNTNQQEIKDQAKSIIQRENLNSGTDAQIKASIEMKLALGQITAEEAAIVRGAREGFTVFEETNKLLNERIKKEKEVNKTLGLTKFALEGMGRIPIVGPLLDTNKALDAAKEKAEAGGGAFASMGAAMGSMLGSLASGLTSPLFLVGLLVKGFQMFMDIGFSVSKQSVQLQKSMASSEEQATATRNRFVEIQNSNESIFETTESLVAAQMELAGAMGVTRGFTDQQVRDQVMLTKEMGFSAEAADGIQKLAMANGMTAKDVTNSVIKQTSALAKQTGIQLDNKAVIEDVAKVSGQLRLQYKNNPTLIAKAVVETKKLGINMEIAANAAKGLLDFESSIENELSAELLTGKSLNLERARGLALNGDSVGAAKEMLAQVGSAADFANMNAIQQEAIAKAVGMSTDDLANSLVTQENMSKLGDETRKRVEEEIEAAKKLGDMEAVRRLEASIGNEDDAEAALIKNDAQTLFTQSIEKLKAMLTSIVEGPAKQFIDYLTGSTDGVSNMQIVFDKIKTTIFGIVKFVKDWSSTIVFIAKIMGIIKAGQITYNALSLLGLGIAKKETSETKKQGLIESVKAAYKIGGTMGPAGLIAIGAMILSGIAAFAMFNKGGPVPGTNTATDSIPAMLTSGEYVIPNSNGKTGTEKYNEMISTPNSNGKTGTEKYNEMISTSSPTMLNEGGKVSINPNKNTGTNSSNNIDLSPLIAAINGLKSDMKALASRPIQTSVQVDGKELATMQGKYPNEAGDANGKVAYKIA